MRIAIDARWIFREISGIGAYTRELISHLATLDTKNEYIILFQDQSILERTTRETGTNNSPNFQHIIIPYGLFSIQNQILLPLFLKRMRIDIFHSPNYMIPLFAFHRGGKGTTKCVTTIHDVIPMIFPNHAPKSKKARLYPIYRRLMIEIGRRSNIIITDSHASAHDIRKHLEIKDHPEKVQPVYCGVAKQFKPLQERPSPLSSNDTRTILYVGRSDPYKNIPNLIRAFHVVRKKSPFPVTLTIAGSIDPRYPETQELAEQLGIGEHVKWTGYISDSQLVALYQNSSVLVHPSRYEGFGLQILEAMACGLPVICANAGSQPEVAGDAAIILSPDDINGMVENINKILSNHHEADVMRQKGLVQAQKFSWSNTALQTLKIYSELIC